MASNPLFRASASSKRLTPSKKGGTAKRVVAASLRTSADDEESDSERVRVAIRLRPKVADDLPFNSDFTDCVELQPELKRLKLRRNNWSSASYKFDEVFTESASQKRVYEVVARPVVESVLDGYNGTVMAYGQTGTGKTYTVGQLGKDDPSESGIMVRSLTDILGSISPDGDTVAVSYFQLYLDSIQDLLAPEKTNLHIVENPKSGEVCLPGAAVVEITNVDKFLELLQLGEANRHAANTKLNSESSRSHAILVVHVLRSARVNEEKETASLVNSGSGNLSSPDFPLVIKSKLLIVDLAGSERIDKPGSEGHLLEEAKFINLSLTSLGRCINELAENSPYISTRDSKLTRLLRDSFGGTARTSLIITIGPSSRHYSETASTIMFGQRAMKIGNIVKLKEECDYENLCRKLQYQIDCLTTEMERQQKLRDNEKEQVEKKMKDHEGILAEVEKGVAAKCELLKEENECLKVDKKTLIEELSIRKEQNGQMSEEIIRLEMRVKQTKAQEKEMRMLHMKLQDMSNLNEETSSEIRTLKVENNKLLLEKKLSEDKLKGAQDKLLDEERLRKCLEQKFMTGDNIAHEAHELSKIDSSNRLKSRETKPGQKATISKIFEEVGLAYILPLLKSEDLDVKIHAVKMIANLAAEDFNQERIVEEGGLDALLILLESSEDPTIYRVTAGAIANLAMNGLNQGLIMSKGGVRLLANIASRTDDPQTLRMVAGASANLCGNESLQVMLKEDGGTKALLRMVRTGHPDVIAQIARGLANFAKCESRGVTQEDNDLDMISSGGIRELLRISHESSREDVKNLTKKAFNSNRRFLLELQRINTF